MLGEFVEQTELLLPIERIGSTSVVLRQQLDPGCPWQPGHSMFINPIAIGQIRNLANGLNRVVDGPVFHALLLPVRYRIDPAEPEAFSLGQTGTNIGMTIGSSIEAQTEMGL
jgi:hypothetical protein